MVFEGVRLFGRWHMRRYNVYNTGTPCVVYTSDQHLNNLQLCTTGNWKLEATGSDWKLGSGLEAEQVFESSLRERARTQHGGADCTTHEISTGTCVPAQLHILEYMYHSTYTYTHTYIHTYTYIHTINHTYI
jgi:hypothetical protein